MSLTVPVSGVKSKSGTLVFAFYICRGYLQGADEAQFVEMRLYVLATCLFYSSIIIFMSDVLFYYFI